MAAPSSNHVPHQTEFETPEGWVLVTKHNQKGELVKYYTNSLGQRFYSEADLLGNINDAKRKGFAIYAPDFIPPTTGPFAMPSKLKVGAASSSNSKHVAKSNGRREGSTSSNKKFTKLKNRKEVESYHEAECGSAQLDEVQCARALLEFSGRTPEDVERRVSRRLSGLQPELRVDFEFNRAFEYIIKDKPL